MKIICIGWNYKPHLKELNGPLPEVPLVFLKPSTCMVHDGDDIVIPEGITNVQYECELALVFGTSGKDIPEEDALSYVSHIAVFNDVTARDMQNEYRKRGDAWSLAKGMDTFGPISDYVSVEGIDLSKLHLTLKVNGEVKQDGCTSDMIFPPAKLISYVSRYMTIEKGDIMVTGTPEGVGQIVPGDIVELEIEGLCRLTNKVVNPRTSCSSHTGPQRPVCP